MGLAFWKKKRKGKHLNYSEFGFGFYKGSLVRILNKDEKNDIAIVCFANCDVPDTIDVKLSEIEFE